MLRKALPRHGRCEKTSYAFTLVKISSPKALREALKSDAAQPLRIITA
jgi:hypothetical protein